MSSFGALPTASTQASLTSNVTTTSSSAASTGMTYRQLEDNITKWNEELDEAEKLFLTQATQVNAWDKLVMENGDKIAALNEDVEKLTLDQDRLDQELDYLTTQQSELENILTPLEENLSQLPLDGEGDAVQSDKQRRDTYAMAENVDAQLKQMVHDLKDIIDGLNATDSIEEVTPFSQLERVLSVHLDSLQWVDQNIDLLQKRMDKINIPQL